MFENLWMLFASLWALLKIFLFGDAILLTPAPIDIQEQHRIILEKPITVITVGAKMRIVTDETKRASEEIKKAGDKAREVSSWTILFETSDAFRKRLDEAYPKESIIVKLYKKDGKSVTLDNMFTWVAGDSFIDFYNYDETPSGEKYYSVEIITKVPLKEVEVTWINYSI